MSDETTYFSHPVHDSVQALILERDRAIDAEQRLILERDRAIDAEQRLILELCCIASYIGVEPNMKAVTSRLEQLLQCEAELNCNP